MNSTWNNRGQRKRPREEIFCLDAACPHLVLACSRLSWVQMPWNCQVLLPFIKRFRVCLKVMVSASNKTQIFMLGGYPYTSTNFGQFSDGVLYPLRVNIEMATRSCPQCSNIIVTLYELLHHPLLRLKELTLMRLLKPVHTRVKRPKVSSPLNEDLY